MFLIFSLLTLKLESKGCAIPHANVPFSLQYAYAQARAANLPIHRLTRLHRLYQAVGIKWQLGCYRQ